MSRIFLRHLPLQPPAPKLAASRRTDFVLNTARHLMAPSPETVSCICSRSRYHGRRTPTEVEDGVMRAGEASRRAASRRRLEDMVHTASNICFGVRVGNENAIEQGRKVRIGLRNAATREMGLFAIRWGYGCVLHGFSWFACLINMYDGLLRRLGRKT